jgi:hypothetical protein
MLIEAQELTRRDKIRNAIVGTARSRGGAMPSSSARRQ